MAFCFTIRHDKNKEFYRKMCKEKTEAWFSLATQAQTQAQA